MMRTMGLAIAATVVVLACRASADVKPGSLFQDNMVLQQGMKVPVWGTASAGEKVTVTFGGQSVSATAGKDGKWKAELGKMKASKDTAPQDMTIAGNNKVTIKNVLVGEVWICCGQSNMEFTLVGAKNARDEIAQANYPRIRMFTVARNPQPAPADSCVGKWAVCSSDTAGNFSAVGYFFARMLHKELGVPVGMIFTSWGGTLADTWTDLDTLAKLPNHAESVQAFRKATEDLLADKAAYAKKREEAAKQLQVAYDKWMKDVQADETGLKEKWFAPATKTDAWQSVDVPMPIQPNVLNGYVGFTWLRRDVEIPKEWVGKDVTLGIGPTDDLDVTWVNGEVVGQTTSEDAHPSQTTPHQYTIPAKLVAGSKLTIVSRIVNTAGAVGLFGEKKDCFLSAVVDGKKQTQPLDGQWKFAKGSPLDMTKSPPLKLPDVPGSSPAEPSTLFNGMVAPLIPYAIRGVTWYQGEAHSSCSNDYYTLFPATIASWRHAWGEGDFPFYYVQIANWLPVQQTPVEISGLAGVRDAQFAALSVPNTGMASAVDIGDADSPHPTNKQEVGRRLALWALAKTYGRKGIVYSGPLYKSVKFDGGKAVVSFDCIGGGLVAKGQPLSGFAIAGADKVYHVAKAEIVGDTVVVSSEKVPQPASVRYAFASNPVGNLYNKGDLPASPFRTDDWEISQIKSAPGETVTVPVVKK